MEDTHDGHIRWMQRVDINGVRTGGVTKWTQRVDIHGGCIMWKQRVDALGGYICSNTRWKHKIATQLDQP